MFIPFKEKRFITFSILRIIVIFFPEKTTATQSTRFFAFRLFVCTIANTNLDHRHAAGVEDKRPKAMSCLLQGKHQRPPASSNVWSMQLTRTNNIM
jgi:hypothetical protein